ncbi:type II 3-dehydroquinate dehydratase [uncultured Arthrobacter sp.]|uniref:type II 3-dehydroquinate dehydratase n=1 Tax=uncultured Arthrobacter sp. TaxID=114050 RepID=UPI00321677AE
MTTQLDFMRVPFAADLASYGDRPAILADTLVLTYRELADRVDELAAQLGTERRLVALAAANDLESLVAYLAALAGGHPLILLPEDKPAALDSLIAAYDPDVVLRSGEGRTVLEERRPGTRHELHPDLALLLSTSGSTGSPKLVRLSHANLQSNAESELVGAIHAARGRCAAIVINAGALTHYGWSLHDALAAYDGIVIELHLSNPLRREAWRSTSVIAPVATGSIAGIGGAGYALAIDAVAALLSEGKDGGSQ